ncbi:MAG TPA: molybdopterin molybdotransferase MoeA [Bacteroidales bacterium]|nr:molybdopterin molybdotransferase MoeA [Bacteroidales bacterium]
MITFEEAFGIVALSAIELETERTELAEAAGRILAEDVFSDMDMPPFNKSAVDGYACRREDLEGELTVIEVIPAGKIPEKAVGKGQCSKLMTGGMVPEGADTVVMIEDIETTGENTVRFKGENTSANIAVKAEDIRKGALVLEKGIRLTPPHIAVLASVGCARPLVSRKPRVAVISTGDELVEPSQVPGIARIRNSNAYQLLAQARNAGCDAAYYGIASDNEEHTYNKITAAQLQSDIILLTGGVSTGDFDFVPAIIEKAGFDIKFRTMAVQPGKPTIFAVRGKQFLFGLPGNPVSAFVQFHLLGGMLIRKMTGCTDEERILRIPMGVDYRRKKASRKSFIPVKVTTAATVLPVEYHGSAHIHSFVHADGIISIEIGQTELLKGSLVDVRLL